MKIKFLGVGSQFSTMEYYHSNMLITSQSGKKMLLDCGSDAKFSLSECRIAPNDIDAVYISHLHSDHIGGMEWMAVSTYFAKNRKMPKLFAEKGLMKELWDYSLKGGLECIQGRCLKLSDYFDCSPAQEDGVFRWEGIGFTLKKMPHINSICRNHYSYGLLIENAVTNKLSVFITTDTQFQPDILKETSRRASLIFHDCETTRFKTTVHAHYDELRTLPPEIKRKIWLYHYQPNPPYIPEKDGFMGFVRKGQEFDL